VLFDGVCNFCSGSVQFIVKRDKKGLFRFAPLQSETGKKYATEPESILLVDGDRVYARSDAALRIAKHLRFPWMLAWIFIVVPRFLRDAIYKFIARNRYKWFGKKEVCMVPTPELRARFIE